MANYFMVLEQLKPWGFGRDEVVKVRRRVIWRLIKLVDSRIHDPRQSGKVRHPLRNIIVLPSWRFWAGWTTSTRWRPSARVGRSWR